MDGNRADSTFDALCGALPREALAVIADLISVSGRPEALALARKLREKAGFVLESVAPDGRRRGLFSAIPPFPRASRKLSAPNLASCAQVAPEDVAAWFGPDGRFAAAIPGYEPRPEQMRMAEAVARAFNEGRHLVVEAGTGVGKTMAYLVPAVLWSLANKAPVVVCTSTKNLQEQIFRKDLPVLASLLSSPVRFALVKGRGNYLCLSRLEQLLERREAELAPEAFAGLARAVAWAFATDSGDVGEFDPGDCGRNPFPVDRICSSGDDCRGRGCPYRGSCFLQKARAAALSADLVVTNHAVFFSEPDDEPLALPKAAQVVFDEAHNLEESATEHFSREATPASLRRLLRRAYAKRRLKRGAAGSGATGAVADAERFLVSGGTPPGGPETRQALLDAAGKAADAADAAARAVREWGRALGMVPRPDEGARRIRPETLQSPAWKNTEPALRKLQDALFALSSLLDALAAGFSPPSVPGTPARTALPAPASPPGAAAPFPPPAAPQDGAAETARRLAAVSADIREALHVMDFLAAADDEEWAYWIESAPVPRGGGVFPDGRSPAAEAGLRAAPVDVSEFLANGLFAKRDSVVLCSATLRVGGATEWISRRLGLDRMEKGRVAEVVEGSPFDYASQCLAAVPMFLPPQQAGNAAGRESEAFSRAFAEMLARLARTFGGRTMALFTSHRMLRSTAARLRETLRGEGFRVLAQGEGIPRDELTALFREADAPSVLLGADSFWEGVDLIGAALRCVVLAKLPFASPGDPLVDARGERVERDGGSKFRDWAVPGAVVKFRQGFGRLIRHRSDRGVAVFADTRIFDKGYGAIFRRALPLETVRYDDPEAFYRDIAAFLAPGAPAALPPPSGN